MRLVYLPIALLCVFTAGCATSGDYTRRSDEFTSGRFSTIALNGLIVGPTLGASAAVEANKNAIIDKAVQTLTAKGYQVSQKGADLKATLRLIASQNVIMERDQLRFEKGTRGSHFPSANPRMRSYQSDSLVLEAFPVLSSLPQQKKGKAEETEAVFIGVCRIDYKMELPHGKPAFLPATSVPLDRTLKCLDYLLANFPPQRAPAPVLQ